MNLLIKLLKYISLSITVSFALVVVSFNYSSGQKSISTSDLLNRAVNNYYKNTPYSESLNFYNSSKQGIPFFDNLGFRTETSEMDYTRQQYQLRIEFNSRKERQAMKSIISSNKEILSVKQDLILQEYLKSLNLDIILYYFTSEDLLLFQKELIIKNDIKTIYKKLLENNTNFNVSKWLSNEEDIIDLKTKILKNSEKLITIKTKLLNIDSTFYKLKFNDWISVDDIQKKLVSLDLFASDNPKYQISKLNEKSSFSEYNLEKAEGKKWFDFLKIQYQNKNKLEPFQEFSVGTSFNIPLKSNNQINKNSSYLDVLKNEYKTSLLFEELENELTLTNAKLKRLIKEYSLLTKLNKEQKTENTFESYNKIESISPLVLLEIKQMILNQEYKELKIKKEVFNTYIELLTISGKLIQKPLQNYLSISSN